MVKKSMVGETQHLLSHHPSLTFGAQIQAFHIEDAIAEGDLLQDYPKTVDVAFLGASEQGVLNAQELWGCPQFLWEAGKQGQGGLKNHKDEGSSR